MENDINNHNICVVGAGNWGRNHIRTLHQLNSLGAVVEKFEINQLKFRNG